MRYSYRKFRKFIERFKLEIEQMSKEQPEQYLAILALSSQDSEQEPQVIISGMKETQDKIIREFYNGCHRN
ncbi:MAG: hypothetical protein WD266_04375 [Balneolales bacterium]